MNGPGEHRAPRPSAFSSGTESIRSILEAGGPGRPSPLHPPAAGRKRRSLLLTASERPVTRRPRVGPGQTPRPRGWVVPRHRRRLTWPARRPPFSRSGWRSGRPSTLIARRRGKSRTSRCPRTKRAPAPEERLHQSLHGVESGRDKAGRNLLRADLQEEPAHDLALRRGCPIRPRMARYPSAQFRERWRTRAMNRVRSFTEMAPRASSMLKVCEHLRQ